jgi:HEPN domain-containing protein
MNEKVSYWIEIADYDFETAKAMLVSKRYLYVGFMCHQTIEKILKAYYCSTKEDIPPYIHNLKSLAERCELLSHFSEEQLDFMEELLPMNIEARYPTHKGKMFKILTPLKCKEIIKQTEILCQWIKQRL